MASKEKRFLFKNGFVWSVVLLIASIVCVANNNLAAGPLALASSMVLLITLIKRIGRLFQRRHGNTSSKHKANTADLPETVVKAGEDASFFDVNVIYSSIPQHYLGGRIAYSYNDVQYECINENLALTIPENHRITTKVDRTNQKDVHSLQLFYHDECIGYMKNNRLKDMVYDFGSDTERSFLILGGVHGERPTLKLFFYYLSDQDNDYCDDDDDDDE